MGIEKHEMSKLIADLQAKIDAMSKEDGRQEIMRAMGFVAGKMLDGYLDEDAHTQRIIFLRTLATVGRLPDYLSAEGQHFGDHEVLSICCSALAWKIAGFGIFCAPGCEEAPDNAFGAAIVSAIAAARFSNAAMELQLGHDDPYCSPMCSTIFAAGAVELLGSKPADVFEY